MDRNPRFVEFEKLLFCGRRSDTDCPFWECCAWGQHVPIDIPIQETR